MINIENLKEFLGSDDEFIVTLMEKFISEIPREGANLRQATDHQDWRKVRAISHKMLSSTKIFNLEVMTTILHKVERLSENESNLEQLPGLVSEFETASAEAIKEMQKLKTSIALGKGA